MRYRKVTGDVVLAFAAVALAAAVGLLVRARFVPEGDGFRDLADVAGALLLASGSGLLSGAALLAYARDGPRALVPWRLPVAAACALAGGCAALVLLRVAIDAGTLPLAAFALVIAVTAFGGLAVATRAVLRDRVTGRV